MTKELSNVHGLVGIRSPRNSIEPRALISIVDKVIQECRQLTPTKYPSLSALKVRYGSWCRNYYTAAAVTRRHILEEDCRRSLLNRLLECRVSIERALLRDLDLLEDQESLWNIATQKSFFGVSAKQGVSIRFALASCSPTKHCGGRCYAHDGRDRELHLLFRATLNLFVGRRYEDGQRRERKAILTRLDKAINYGIQSAMCDADSARIQGFQREPRIRFSHIGEMVTTPNFTNDLGRTIMTRNDNIACVIYTRHPDAAKLDLSVFRINFTIEQDDDPRRKYAPAISRLVNSAWDGKISSEAAVNFLEHHVEKVSAAIGFGRICPAITNHKTTPSCDLASCDLCFRSVVPR